MATLNIETAFAVEELFGSPLVGQKSQLCAENTISMYKMFGENRNKALLKELVSRGYLSSDVFGSDLLALTANLNSSTHNALFRTSYTQETNTAPAFKLWLGVVTSKAKILADQKRLNYSPTNISEQFISEVAQYSVQPEFARELPSILEKKGVVLIYEPGLTGMKTDGVFVVLPNGVPVIALTLRYSRVDYFWYTLLHELSHLQLHYSPDMEVISDDFDEKDSLITRIEYQADKLALNSIVPRAYWRRTQAYKRRTKNAVETTANEFKVHPALIAGRLRREFDLYNDRDLSNIVNAIDMRAIIYGS